MNRQNNVPFIPLAMPPGAAPPFRPPQPGSIGFPANRVPQSFREAMKSILVKKPADNTNTKPVADMAAVTPPAKRRRAAQSSAPKWKSSFQPLGDDDDEDEPEDKSTNSPERVELYDPYDPASSDSEHETQRCRDRSPSPQGHINNLERQRLSPGRGSHDNRRWHAPYSEPGSQPEIRRTKSRCLSPGHRLPDRRSYSPDTESHVKPTDYGSISRPLDHRVASPDRLTHGSPTQRIPAFYGARRANGEERMIIPEYRREMTTTSRLSPSTLQRDYRHNLTFLERGLDKIASSTEVTRNGSKQLIMDENPITCDLCDIELSNGQELQDHLESKTHWDTLEHIQKENNYDDMTIAFLQEVMLYKTRRCSPATEDSAAQALQENDHMTKIEIFHCAACNVFLATSTSSVHSHIFSQEHLSNTKVFEAQQRRSCLDMAETMLKELKPQFEHFLKGGSPFE